MSLEFVLILAITFALSVVLTPLVRKLAFKIGATDKPDKRRVNKKEMPTIGGLAIYLAFFISVFFFLPIPFAEALPIFLGASVVIATGIIDDIKEINPKQKMIGLLVASCIVYFMGDIRMNMITLPFFGQVNFGILSFPITIIWILAITNSVNLIDGLDGLATGVSAIALATMGIIGYAFLTLGDVYVPIMIFTLVAAMLGFLPYNFYPAKIFLGDTGALFLGFMISVMSLQGLKNVTFISMIIPIVALGVPITDTVYAILRRYLNKRPITSADKMHLHHRLMSLGLSHRQTVIAIYCLAFIFSFIAVLYKVSNLWGAVFLTIGSLLGLELFVELIGLVGENHQPLLSLFRKYAKTQNKNDDEEK